MKARITRKGSDGASRGLDQLSCAKRPIIPVLPFRVIRAFIRVICVNLAFFAAAQEWIRVGGKSNPTRRTKCDRPVPPRLAPGGSGPHDPGMEMRVARLEEDMRAVRTDVSAMRADTSYIRGRVKSLPTTWSMIGTMIAGNMALVGLLVAAAKLFGH